MLFDSLADFAGSLTESFSTAVTGGAHFVGTMMAVSTVFNTVSPKPENAQKPNIYRPLSPVINLAPGGMLIQ